MPAHNTHYENRIFEIFGEQGSNKSKSGCGFCADCHCQQVNETTLHNWQYLHIVIK